MTYTPRGSEEFTRKVGLDITPKEGMIFLTLKEGINFYRQYGIACGFDIRLSSQRRFRDGTIRTKDVICNREGFTRESQVQLPKKSKKTATSDESQNNNQPPKNAKKPTTQKNTLIRRFGCDAKIKFVFEAGKYKVETFYEGHNHKLVLPENKEFQKLSRNLTLYHKQTIIDHAKLNIGATQSYRICKEYANGYENIGATLLDFKNFGRDVKCFIGLNDAQLFISNFKSLAETKKGFYFAYELDEGRNLSKIFWCDSQCRKSYSVFGDAMSYDPTYGTNKYFMVFTPFTGVDHHKRSVTFGAALLAHEDEISFKWAFEKFLDAMGNKEPQYIITDQDPAIKKAVPAVFKKARHRFCMWHIMTKVPDKVGTTVYKDTDFSQRLNEVVWDGELEPHEFETKWSKVTYFFLNNLFFTYSTIILCLSIIFVSYSNIICIIVLIRHKS
jgi:hypothetical protein